MAGLNFSAPADLTGVLAETNKIDLAPVDGLVGVEDSLSYQIGVINRHIHNRMRYWGSNGAPTETNAIAATVSVPFVAVSGNDTWGAAIPICGTADLPIADAAGIEHDAHMIFVVDADHATPYRFRIIWGTGTSGEAIAAGQWSEVMFITLVAGPCSSGVPVDIAMRRIAVGTKLWAQVWNVNNGSSVDFYWGTHGYEG